MYEISKQVVLEAYEKVKGNKGAAGVDNISLADFEKDLKDNLYKIWNRMSSGSYMPPPVRMVEIPKSDGKIRRLGIPTVADRVAQMVAKLHLEPLIEPYFHEDSYGYRPDKSAHDAIGVARTRCWKYDWAIDLDIKGFFDNLNHNLVMRAVEKHTECKWLRLYIERWLTASTVLPDGQIQERTMGTPQGGVISPLLANLFLHYAFDMWMEKVNPNNPFERYADDIVVHCKTLPEAESLKKAIEERLKECHLELNQEKTRIVYCKNDASGGNFPHYKFDFLGYTFQPRGAKNREGNFFTSFLPAISDKAENTIRQTVRDWKLLKRSDMTLEKIADEFNPAIRGWLSYYGKFYKSALNPLFQWLNKRLALWAMRKYKGLGGIGKAVRWLERIAAKHPSMFVHWQQGIRVASGQ